LDLNGKQLTTPLTSWEDLGTQSFVGPAIYHKQFTAPTVPAGKKIFLEIADARDYVRIRVNGATFDAHAWQPYRWDITSSLQPGSNDLQINVFASPSGRGGGGAAAAAGGRAGQVGPTGSATAIAAAGGGNRFRGVTSPVLSGLIGPVRLVAR
jgi:hypothetical protein